MKDAKATNNFAIPMYCCHCLGTHPHSTTYCVLPNLSADETLLQCCHCGAVKRYPKIQETSI